MSCLPPGWTKERVLVTGRTQRFSAPLRDPVNNVVFATVVSFQGPACMIKIDGFDQHYSSARREDGSVKHFTYFASNLNNELNKHSYDPPILPHVPPKGKNYSRLTVTLLDAFGEEIDDAISHLQIDLWCYNLEK